ncbi:hypothetical protein Bca101_003915 [Brassica carinata]
MKAYWNITKSTIPVTLSVIFLFINNQENVFAAPPRPHLCRPEQRDALVKLKNELEVFISPFGYNCYVNGTILTPHPKTVSWEIDNDCCTWEGITCNPESGEVIKLDLSCSYLRGQLHSNISLHSLTALDLSSNDFNGQIMSSLGNLSLLTSLNLSYNRFSGQIPSSIGNLSHLTSLDLSDNQLSGQLPSWIGNLSHLTQLDLSSNNFSGQIPSIIGKLSHLTFLVLSSNQIVGQIPSFGNLNRLLSLVLDSNMLTGNFPSNHVSVTNKSSTTYDLVMQPIQSLLLSGCGITEFPELLKTKQFLTDLDVSKNKLKGQVPGWLWTLPYLRHVDLSNNNLINFERSPRSGPSLMMAALLVSNNNFTGNIPSFICDLPSLRTLDLSNNNFDGVIPSCMANLRRTLTDLNLGQNRLHGGLPEYIFKYLRSFDVGHNQLTGKLPRALIHSTYLEVLNVGNNLINDTFPFWLSSLPNLKVLVLRSNLFHGPILLQAPFPKLQIIDVSHNHFNGALPSDYFVKWSAMSSLSTNEDKLNRKDNIHTPASHKQYETTEESDEEVLSWIAAVIGAVPGVILGLTIGYILVSYRPEWRFITYLKNLED